MIFSTEEKRYENMKRVQSSGKIAGEKHIGAYVFLILMTFFVLIPLFWVLMNSLKSKSQYLIDPNGFPKELMFSNYLEAFKTINMPTLYKNSFFLSIVSVAGALLFTAPASFVLARYKFKINKSIYAFFLIGMMIPLNAAIIPLFVNLKSLGLTNSYLGVIIPYIAFQTPMGIFLITNYMKGIPDDIEEAAILDGCNNLQLMGHIFIPISKPIFATYTIITFMAIWNEFLFALVFLTGDQYKTVSLGLAAFRGQYDTNTTCMLAATIMAMLPMIIVYILLHDQIIKGMTAGATKG